MNPRAELRYPLTRGVRNPLDAPSPRLATKRGAAGKNSTAAADLRNFAETENVKLKVLDVDVTSDESVDTAVAQIAKDAGRFDVVINNAGLGYGGPVEAFTSQQFMHQLDVNIVGCHRVNRAVVPHMRKKKSGLLIHLSSIAGRIAMPGLAAYHASKWGLEGYCEALKYELGPLGIDCAIVQPGPFSTNFFGNLVEPADAESAKAYSHVTGYFSGFGENVEAMFKDPDAPTDPQIVVDDFIALIDAAPGKRPLRTVSGVDFGVRHINGLLEPVRVAAVEEMGLAEMDKTAT